MNEEIREVEVDEEEVATKGFKLSKKVKKILIATAATLGIAAIAVLIKSKMNGLAVNDITDDEVDNDDNDEDEEEEEEEDE